MFPVWKEQSLTPLLIRARAWAYETGVCVDQSMDQDLPYNKYYEVNINVIVRGISYSPSVVLWTGVQARNSTIYNRKQKFPRVP